VGEEETVSAFDELNALMRRLDELSHLTSASVPMRFADEKDRALDIYRRISGICKQAIDGARLQQTPVSPALVEVAQSLLSIARIVTSEYDRIAREEAESRERSKRWSEVREEFEAAQTEGRRMRRQWSWEQPQRRQVDLESFEEETP
jgi:hypothetical protein